MSFSLTIGEYDIRSYFVPSEVILSHLQDTDVSHIKQVFQFRGLCPRCGFGGYVRRGFCPHLGFQNRGGGILSSGGLVPDGLLDARSTEPVKNSGQVSSINIMLIRQLRMYRCVSRRTEMRSSTSI